MQAHKSDNTFPNKTEMLHSAIHQMSKSEKRSFRLEMNKLKQGSNYETAFDYLASIGNLDIELFHKYMEKKGIKSPLTITNYLFDKVVSHLTKTRLSLSEDTHKAKIEQLLTSADTALLLGFFKHSHKLRLKALKLAYEHEEYYYIARSIYKVYNLEARFALEGLSGVLEKYSGNSNIEENIQIACDLHKVYCTSNVLFEQIILYRFSGGTPQQMNDLINNNVLNRSLDEVGFKNSLMILRTKIRYYDCKKDYKNVVKNCIQLIDMQEKNPKFTAQHLRGLMADYSFICRRLFLSKDDRLEEYSKRYSNLLVNWDDAISNELTDYQRKMNEELHYINDTIFQKQLLLLQEHFTLNDIEHLSTRKMLNWSQTLIWNYLISNIFSAYLCLLIREYDFFHQYKALIVKNLKKKPRCETQWEVRLMSLIKYYENNEKAAFIQQLNDALHESKGNKNVPDTVAYMLRLLKYLSDEEKDERVLLAEALREIQSVEKYFYEPHLPFSIWVKWRSEGKLGGM